MTPLRARLVASRPGAQSYARTLLDMPADLVGAEGSIADLVIHPVKGFGGLHVSHARIERRGLVDPATGLADRGVMLAFPKEGVTPEGEAFEAIALANRIDGTTSLAKPRIEGGILVYEAPGVPPLRLDPATLAQRDGPTLRVRVYEGGPVHDGVVIDSPLVEWTQALLRAHPAARRFDVDSLVALVPPASYRREVSAKHRAGEDADTLYSDGAHLLVASASTLRWMNAQLAAQGATRAIDMAAFRPNVVLDGLPPNAEDLAREVEVAGQAGVARIVFATYCVRCDATRVDVATGAKPDKQPLAFLAKERPPREGEPTSATFAINAIAAASSHGRELRVGSRVRVVRERE